MGDVTAKPLMEAIATDNILTGEVIVFKDILHVGPLKTENLTFSEGRSAFWSAQSPQQNADVTVNDLERLMEVSSRLSNDDGLQIWFWMAPTPADVCAYFWLLHFLKKHQGRFYVLNINGLPFLDENGKLFYPESIGYIPVKEFAKAKKLARVITPSEWESDADEWPRLLTENAGMRIFEGGKRVKGADIDVYDQALLDLVTTQSQKITKVINIAITKLKIPTGDAFLLWRLHQLATAGKLTINKTEIALASGEKALGNASDISNENLESQ